MFSQQTHLKRTNQPGHRSTLVQFREPSISKLGIFFEFSLFYISLGFPLVNTVYNRTPISHPTLQSEDLRSEKHKIPKYYQLLQCTLLINGKHTQRFKCTFVRKATKQTHHSKIKAKTLKTAKTPELPSLSCDIFGHILDNWFARRVAGSAVVSYS